MIDGAAVWRLLRRVIGFVGGAVLGALGLWVAAFLALFVLSRTPEAAERIAGRTLERPTRLEIQGPWLDQLGARNLRFDAARSRLTVACRDGCDDLRVDDAHSVPKADVRNASGDCVLCSGEARWVGAGVGALALRQRDEAAAGGDR